MEKEPLSRAAYIHVASVKPIQNVRLAFLVSIARAMKLDTYSVDAGPQLTTNQTGAYSLSVFIPDVFGGVFLRKNGSNDRPAPWRKLGWHVSSLANPQ